MNRLRLIFRLILVAVLLAAISWLAFHREFLEAARLERELERSGRRAPLLFVGLYALSTVLFVFRARSSRSSAGSVRPHVGTPRCR